MLPFLRDFKQALRAEDEKLEFIRDLKLAEECFKDNSATDAQKKLAEAYFILNEDGTMQDFGYFLLLSNHSADAIEALSIYRNKDVVEKTFCNLKNRLDMKRTKVSSEESLAGVSKL